MKRFFEVTLVWLGILFFIVALYNQFTDGMSFGPKVEKVPFSEFLEYVESGKVAEVVIEGYEGREISGKLKDGTNFRTKSVYYIGLIDDLRKNNVNFEIKSGETVLGLIASLLISCFPILLAIGVWVFFLKQMQLGGSKTMNFAKSKARMLSDKQVNVTFKDVAGIDEEVLHEVLQLVDYLKFPKKYTALGGRIPKGCLLVGSPGTGKTLLARAIAGEAGVPFFFISGSDFVEMFVGVGASRVRDMFAQALKSAPCIVFIDEIDAVGRHRGVGLGGGNDEREQTLNQLLVEMDGFESNEGVIILAATNRAEVLDPALLRPGRFDRQVVISLPDNAGREQILKVHTKKLPLAPDVDLKIAARGTPGFSGADLANLVNEAALVAARKNKKMVTTDDFEYARDKVLMGVERRSRVMKEEEKRLTAYHEAGHAILAFYTPASDPIHKVTIIPRGSSLGLVMRLPEYDRVSMPREKLLADMLVAMGGRAAEELIFGEDKVTSGASSDIKLATELAKSMVMKWGMSEKVGPLYHDEDKLLSDEAANLIDFEIRNLVVEMLAKARVILREKLKELHLIANTLLKEETLTGADVKHLLEEGTLPEKILTQTEKIKKSSIKAEEAEGH